MRGIQWTYGLRTQATPAIRSRERDMRGIQWT
jgi:hypothetical protein